ncbi:HNH endonuclease [Sulfidibacter corallicola]|uniref:HNH endonuclease n=1 Tax=Sulfidibacter corallicola TaxID=2818388 RepID=A0A8A4TGM6_SULCO|nr:HNH endonuclease [Sulfidibacter corallicola]QTD48364.1 HNH endonuclease [Sulfidibacter corallicola]
MGFDIATGQVDDIIDSPALSNARNYMRQLDQEIKDLLIDAGLDIAGIADPTPISDAISAFRSAMRGDWIGAGLSAISMIPYAGDAIGKTAKGARLMKQINKLKKRLETAQSHYKQVYERTRKALEKRIAKAKRQRKKAKKKGNDNCTDCDGKPSNRLPKTKGKWVEGTPGNGKWMPDKNTPEGKKILAVTGGEPIPYKDGYPDFSKWSKESVPIEMTGDNTLDFAQANMAADFPDTTGHTWHHHQDGTTMQLIPSDLHNNMPHSGGASAVNVADS